MSEKLHLLARNSGFHFPNSRFCFTKNGLKNTACRTFRFRKAVDHSVERDCANNTTNCCLQPWSHDPFFLRVETMEEKGYTEEWEMRFACSSCDFGEETSSSSSFCGTRYIGPLTKRCSKCLQERRLLCQLCDVCYHSHPKV